MAACNCGLQGSLRRSTGPSKIDHVQSDNSNSADSLSKLREGSSPRAMFFSTTPEPPLSATSSLFAASHGGDDFDFGTTLDDFFIRTASKKPPTPAASNHGDPSRLDDTICANSSSFSPLPLLFEPSPFPFTPLEAPRSQPIKTGPTTTIGNSPPQNLQQSTSSGSPRISLPDESLASSSHLSGSASASGSGSGSILSTASTESSCGCFKNALKALRSMYDRRNSNSHHMCISSSSDQLDMWGNTNMSGLNSSPSSLLSLTPPPRPMDEALSTNTAAMRSLSQILDCSRGHFTSPVPSARRETAPLQVILTVICERVVSWNQAILRAVEPIPGGQNSTSNPTDFQLSDLMDLDSMATITTNPYQDNDHTAAAQNNIRRTSSSSSSVTQFGGAAAIIPGLGHAPGSREKDVVCRQPVQIQIGGYTVPMQPAGVDERRLIGSIVVHELKTLEGIIDRLHILTGPTGGILSGPGGEKVSASTGRGSHSQVGLMDMLRRRLVGTWEIAGRMTAE